MRQNFVEKSTWVPEDTELDGLTHKFIYEIERATRKYIKTHTNNTENISLKEDNNLTTEEAEALKNLKNNRDIIIKPADKGGATVILNRDSYLKEAYRQLNNTKYYVRLLKPLYHDNAKKIRDIINNLKFYNYISYEQYKYLSGPKDYKPRNFYLLPKIHKDKSKWPWPDMPEGRPICSDIDSETYRISSYIDSFLNPLSCRHPSFLKNSYEFVSKIRNFCVERGWLLVTGDVTALYTNMHFKRTIECVRSAFNQYPAHGRPDHYILELLDIILNNNDFTFNNETFQQVLGTAMGKIFSPSLANLYLVEFDRRATHDFRIKPLLFFRYLDDIFFIWPGNIEQLKEYETFLNSLIPDIKITLEHSNLEINFLDVKVYIQDGILKTRTYFKNTDTHQLLHTKSFHPKHTFKGIIKSQLIRFKRLSSTVDDYISSCKILFHYLRDRGYTVSKMRKAQYEILFKYNDKYCCILSDQPSLNNDKINCTDLSACSSQEERDMLPVVVDYCSIGIKLATKYTHIINKYFNRDECRVVTAYKNSKNLKQLLVRSRLQGISQGAFRGCSEPRCYTCKTHATPTTSITSTTNHKSIFIKHNIYCYTKNIIYLITCTHCKSQYVGETGRSLRDRVNDHRSAIKKKSKTPIGVHFNSLGHSMLNFSIVAFDIIENVFERRAKEKQLQKFLGTLHPMGINNLPI